MKKNGSEQRLPGVGGREENRAGETQKTASSAIRSTREWGRVKKKTIGLIPNQKAVTIENQIM